MNEQSDEQERGRARLVVELFESDANGRKMIAWGRRSGCQDVGHGFEPGRGVYTRLRVDGGDPQQHNFLMELVDNPAGLRAWNQTPRADHTGFDRKQRSATTGELTGLSVGTLLGCGFQTR